MARKKGTGNLQREKNGVWTLRAGIKGKRYSRSTGTTNREAAEHFAQRFLIPYGRGSKRLPLADVWFEYERSPNRNDLAPSTLRAKRQVWMNFARWMDMGHVEVEDLGQITSDMIGEYLRCLRLHHCATTYNNHVCVLREICHVLQEKAGFYEDPWEGVRLLCDDAHPRREFTIKELKRLLTVAKTMPLFADAPETTKTMEWHTLILIGLYTGLRLGDCCTLAWSSINLERNIIQVIPQKTRKHAHGRPVTIPIHPMLRKALKRIYARRSTQPDFEQSPHVVPTMASWYRDARWRLSEGLKRIFKAAHITTSVRIEGRRYKAPEATFHSLRHTFVSFSANAGVPLTIIRSIVGHSSSVMTRHYYHESETALQSAIAALPDIVSDTKAEPRAATPDAQGGDVADLAKRLHMLDALLASATITPREYKAMRTRILKTV